MLRLKELPLAQRRPLGIGMQNARCGKVHGRIIEARTKVPLRSGQRYIMTCRIYTAQRTLAVHHRQSPACW